MPVKKHDNLFEQIVSWENIQSAYNKSLRRGGRYRPETVVFSLNETENLRRLQQSLIDETYAFSGYISFPVYEPKKRIVDAPHYKDKIVQLAIVAILNEVYHPAFIKDSYACIDGRGTHSCAKRIQSFLQKARREYGEDAYILKIDFAKFFYSIDRRVLKSIFRKKIICKRTLRLLDVIIDSADAIGPLGMPLGNPISQLSANAYLHELDRYCKRRLSLRYYVRYNDDIAIVLSDRELARKTLVAVEDFAGEKLHLQLNKKKTKIFPLAQGINMVGYKIYSTHMLLRNDYKKRIKRKLNAMPRLIVEGKLPARKAEQMLNSSRGHAQHACSYNFMCRLMKKHRFIYRRGKTLKIDVCRLGGDKCAARV